MLGYRATLGLILLAFSSAALAHQQEREAEEEQDLPSPLAAALFGVFKLVIYPFNEIGHLLFGVEGKFCQNML